MNINELPKDIKISYISMTKTAIFLKDLGYNKEMFLYYCLGIWESMELNERDTLLEIINESVKDEVEKFIKSKEEIK